MKTPLSPRKWTIEPPRVDEARGARPEFGRLNDVERLFGLKRGTTYNLLRTGKIKGCLIRPRGEMKGVRIIDLDSVRNYFRTLMENQEEADDASN